MYQALVTDLDGTAVILTSNGEDVDHATKQSVQRAIAKGKKLACATGRPWELAKPVIKALGFTTPCIVEGGTRIVNPSTEETVWEKVLPKHATREIFELFKSESDHGLLMHSEAFDPVAPVHSVSEVPKTLRFIYLLGVKEDVAIKIVNRVNVRPDVIAHLTPSWYGHDLLDIHVTHREATKEHAIHVWQRLEKVSRPETIGMGDSGNDLPIFMSAGFRVAVENATTELKEVADYIAPPAKKHALKHIIDTFLLK